MSSIDKSYDLYLKMLSLMPLVAKYAEERIEIAKNKKLPTYEDLNPNCKFINNRVIAQLAASHDLEVLVENKGLGWVKNPEIIKHLYNKLINSEYYQTYMLNSPGEKESYKKDLHLVQDFYINTVRKEDRSLMNVPFVTGNEELDAKFVKEAAAAGFVNLKGHRSVGGMRASIYNAMPIEGVEKLVEFMREFEKNNA